MTLCDDIRAAQSELDAAIRDAEKTPAAKSVIDYGNDKLSKILKPLIDLEKQAIDAIDNPAKSAKIAEQIREAGESNGSQKP